MSVGYLTELRVGSPARVGGTLFLGTMVTSDGTEFPLAFPTLNALREFIRTMAPESIEVDCLPAERIWLERACGSMLTKSGSGPAT